VGYCDEPITESKREHDLGGAWQERADPQAGPHRKLSLVGRAKLVNVEIVQRVNPRSLAGPASGDGKTVSLP
jgi:hypothetical protein